jgi:hypothetical protein
VPKKILIVKDTNASHGREKLRMQTKSAPKPGHTTNEDE